MTLEAEREGPFTEDTLLDGRVRLRQPRRGHRAGTDAVLLAGLADVREGDRVVDLGSASGAVGLMIAARVRLGRLTLVERDPDLVALARENIALNGCEAFAGAVRADAFTSELDTLAGEADLVVTNPPFFDDAGPSSPDPRRRAAHVMQGGTLSDWLVAAARMLGPRGRLCLIHRADEAAACLSSLLFGSAAIVPIYPRIEADASRIVVSAVRGGRSPLRILPALVLHGPDGRFTAEAALLHGSGARAKEKGAAAP